MIKKNIQCPRPGKPKEVNLTFSNAPNPCMCLLLVLTSPLQPTTQLVPLSTKCILTSQLLPNANDYGSLIIATNTGLLITVIILFNSRANLKTHCSSFTCHLCCCFHPGSCLCSSPWPSTLPKCAALLIAGPDSYQFQAQDEFGNMATINQCGDK